MARSGCAGHGTHQLWIWRSNAAEWRPPAQKPNGCLPMKR